VKRVLSQTVIADKVVVLKSSSNETKPVAHIVYTLIGVITENKKKSWVSLDTGGWREVLTFLYHSLYEKKIL